MMSAWRQLGLTVEFDNLQNVLQIQGCQGQLPTEQGDIFVANSGTSIRFLTAALSACSGEFLLDGVPRMRERPIRDLLDALRNLGADVHSRNPDRPDCPPIHLNARGLAGGCTEIAGNLSSQYLSGLMLAAPLARDDVQLDVVGHLVSVPYVEMTAAVMQAFGAQVRSLESNEQSRRQIEVSSAHRYVGIQYSIEPDASAASYFWAAAAICGGQATVQGLHQNSLQGDVRFCEMLEQMGCSVSYGHDSISVTRDAKLRGVSVNMADISDTVQTLSAVALFASGPTSIRGVAHNRVKETDRISDLARELRKLGAEIDEYPDGLTIHPPARIHAARLDTYQDHRMAMSLALVGLSAEGIEINDPDCTGKTYPDYWRDLATFCGGVIERID